VHRLIHSLLIWFIHFGIVGPFLLGVLDSSFLFLPLGNDLLVVVLVARERHQLPLLVATATLGSTAGVLLLDLVMRRGGEQGIRRFLDRRRFENLRKRIAERAGVALILACVAPPPFPFTLTVAAASALQYPRPQLLSIVAVCRAVRFLILGLLALRFGPHIIRIIRTSAFEWFMGGLVAFCLAGSAFQIARWIRSSRRAVPA
jgi:membrane protein YqaA with SNARE-associated domain